MTDLIEYIPSETLAKEFPEFTKLTVYGTADEPLFPVSQVQEFLGTDRIRLDRGGYDIGEDYIKILCDRKDGRVNEQNLLTEDGLYRVLFKTDTAVSKKFRRFTKVVMRELRLRGQVTVDDAIQKLHKLEQTIAARDQQLEEQHADLMRYKKDSEKYFHQKMDAQTKLLAAQVAIERNTDNYGAEYQLERIKGNCLKKVFVYMIRPPKAVEEEFPDYDENIEPTTDDEICFEISFRSRAEDPCAEFYVYKNITVERLYQKLRERDFSLMIGDKEHRSVFQGSLDRLRYTIDELI
jgi:prophage antirepressor-like protein